MPLPVVPYASSPGGARIAFHVIGNGPAVAMLFPYHVNHLALNWSVPLHRGAMTFLARRFASLAWTSRNFGLVCTSSEVSSRLVGSVA